MFNRLTGRITKAIKTETGLDDLTDILKETEAEAAKTRSQADQARKAALHPALTASEAEREFQAAERVRFEADRLEAACEEFRTRIAAKIEAEQRAAKQKTYDEAKAARDATADKIRKRYPKLAKELAALVREVAEVGDLVDRANEDLPEGVEMLDRPEGFARGFSDNTASTGFVNDAPFLKITRDMYLPDLVDLRGYCWPEQ
jgi:uncharacterized membrane protein YccC